uniref:Uncharacterized protein n=1 Tax=Cucumis melo TaxID=3656 RepID=A0A9I9D970_CUCME
MVWTQLRLDKGHLMKRVRMANDDSGGQKDHRSRWARANGEEEDENFIYTHSEGLNK